MSGRRERGEGIAISLQSSFVSLCSLHSASPFVTCTFLPFSSLASFLLVSLLYSLFFLPLRPLSFLNPPSISSSHSSFSSFITFSFSFLFFTLPFLSLYPLFFLVFPISSPFSSFSANISVLFPMPLAFLSSFPVSVLPSIYASFSVSSFSQLWSRPTSLPPLPLRIKSLDQRGFAREQIQGNIGVGSTDFLPVPSRVSRRVMGRINPR